MSDSRGRFSNVLENLVARFGSLTQFFVWVCVGVFLAQLVTEFVRWPIIQPLFALSGPGIRQGFFWQPLTYMFLHDVGNLFHILINLLFLWFFGREVEYFIGPKPFARLFLLGGLLGGLLWLAVNFTAGYPVLGASAAVLACVIAFATLFPDREITLLIFFVLPVRLKARTLALLAIALDIVPILTHRETGVAHLAHLGGAAFGYLYIKHLGYGRTPGWLAGIQSFFAALKPKPRGPASAPRTAATGRPRKPREELSPDAYIRERVDPILEKISRAGMQSLTAEERRILESAQALLKKRQR